nr:ImmA/IrrE family metallo-endopeptidase [Fredinandcohnia onubensis]
MKYQTTLLEDWIKDFYYKLDIYHPHQLDFLDIAARLGLVVSFQDFSSRLFRDEIIIDKRLDSKNQWQDFAHELCHLLRQEGNQLVMNNDFLNIQESKAENFALHFCVPTFMLLNYEISNFFNLRDGVEYIAETFKVTETFAERRLIHFRNQLHLSKSDQAFKKIMDAQYPKINPENYSRETKILLDKLHKQIRKKEGALA